MFFVKERKIQLMMENPHAAFRDMMGIVANKWREISDKEREHYEALAEKDKVRHEEEKAVWMDYLRYNP